MDITFFIPGFLAFQKIAPGLKELLSLFCL